MFRSAPPRVTTDLSVAEAETRVQELEVLHQEWQQLRGYLSRADDEPLDPGPCPVDTTEEVLVRHQDHRQQLLDQRRRMSDELSRLHPEPHTTEELDDLEDRHQQAGLWEQKRKLLALGTLACPACSHSWPVAAEHLEAYVDVREITRPSISRRKIAEFRQLIGNTERIAAIEAKLAGLQVPEDRSGDLARVRAHAAAVEAYQQALQAWAMYNEDLPRKRDRLRKRTASATD